MHLSEGGSLQNNHTRVLTTLRLQFLGDIHQPLHTESLLRCGNSISVLFNNHPTNLHHVWDTSIPEAHVGGYARPFAQSWAANLTDAILYGRYKAQAENEWLKGMSLADPEGSALVWAGESNAFVCSHVLARGEKELAGEELAGAYFEDAIPVVESLVARAGYRWVAVMSGGHSTNDIIAGWLNGWI